MKEISILFTRHERRIESQTIGFYDQKFSHITIDWFSNDLCIKFLQETLRVSVHKDAWTTQISQILNIFLGYFYKKSTYGFRFNSFQGAKRFKYAFSLDTTRSQVFLLEKKFIGVKFIASILEVRKDNEELYVAYYNRKTRNWKKNLHKEYILLM